MIDLPMHEGTVKFYDPRKGFGYIASPTVTGDVLFEANCVYGGEIKKGDPVKFVQRIARLKPAALRVIVVGNAASEAAYERAQKIAEKQRQINAQRLEIIKMRRQTGGW